MLGGHDDAVADLGLGQAGQGGGEVQHELAAGMGDDREIRVRDLRGLRIELDRKLVLLGFGGVIVHIRFRFNFSFANLIKIRYFCKINRDSGSGPE